MLELRHYDVQLLGGLILHEGRLAEMATGEGKTLVSTLPAYINALVEGKSSYVITVNDYLARRDMEKMGQVHRFLGLTVGLIQSDMKEDARRKAYECDVVYVTNSELGFDYLRDHLALSPAQTVLPGGAGEFDGFCVVDEADSVLIDEARTPLIIAKSVAAPANRYTTANTLAGALREEVHYEVDKKNQNVILNEKGYIDSQRALGIDSLFAIGDDGEAWAPYIVNAVKAKELFEKDVEYNVMVDDDGNKLSIGIIDAFTGRVLDGRRWADGLHQSIEAKEGISVSERSQVIAKVTYQVRSQRFFSGCVHDLHESTRPLCLCTAEGRDMFQQCNCTFVPPIILHSQTRIRTRLSTQCNTIRYNAMQCDSDDCSQALFRQFTRLSGMTGTAEADAQELELTYGLKVTPVPTALPVARRDYPDVAFKTRTAANRALVKEIVAVGGGQPDGRPCLVGTTSVAQSESLVDALKEEGIDAELLNASPKNAPRESEIIAQAGRAGKVTVATNMAGRGTDILLGGCSKTMSRIKARSFLVQSGLLADDEIGNVPPSPPESYYPCPISDDVEFLLKDAASTIRKAVGSEMTGIELDELLTVANDATESEEDPVHIMKLREATEAVREAFADVLEPEKDTVKAKGGLYVMGTNRHESSRIDGQLRGRAGRQGDPGSSRFFLSFEDDMFVVFGGDGLDKILETFRVSEDMPVEAPQVTDALNKVQKRVEEKYREIRSEIFRFDETLNGQRSVIYDRRRSILFATAEESAKLMLKYNADTVADIVKAQTSPKGVVDTDKALSKVGQFFPSVEVDGINGLEADAVTDKITTAVNGVFSAKMDEMEAAAKAAGRPPNALGRSANYITLVTMDNAWSDHLQQMENLKEAVILRRFENIDPSQEYKNEAFELFEGLESKMRFNAVFSLWQTLAPAKQAA